MVKTTGGPALCAKVVSPALTSGAVSLLQEHLTTEEKELWVSLGPNWTSHWFVCLCMCVWISVLQCVRVSCCSNKPSRHLSQFAAQCDSSSIHTCLPGWVAASDLWLDWSAFGRSHRVTTQTGCCHGKQRGTDATGPSSTDSRGCWWSRRWGVSL